jgi:hypothetical protein
MTKAAPAAADRFKDDRKERAIYILAENPTYLEQKHKAE